MRRLFAPALLALLFISVACQKQNSVFADRAGVYKIVLTNEQVAKIAASQRLWEAMRDRNPDQAAQYPEPRLAAQGMSIELKPNGKFVFRITSEGKPEVLEGTYEFKEDKLIMTAESYNGNPARASNKTEEYDYNAETHTIEMPGADGPQKFRR